MVFASLMLTACETTGDPREGGFFGWSEVKARARGAEREQTLSRGERHLADETGRTRDLRARESLLSSEFAHADAQQRLRLERLQRQFAATRQRVKAFEDAAFTSATASRARRLRAEVEATGGDGRRTPEERIARLRVLDGELKAEKIQPTR